jgi:hypothetical protein
VAPFVSKQKSTTLIILRTHISGYMMEHEREQNRLLNEKYGLVPKPTSYRQAKFLCHRMDTKVPQEPSYMLILSLAENDRSFCLRLHNDKAFHDIFWKRNRLGKDWKPISTEEMEMAQQIDDAIRSRIKLVIAQKVYLGLHYREISNQSKQTQVMNEANNELAYMPQWLDQRNQSHRALYEEILQVALLDYEVTNVIATED